MSKKYNRSEIIIMVAALTTGSYAGDDFDCPYSNEDAIKDAKCLIDSVDNDETIEKSKECEK